MIDDTFTFVGINVAVMEKTEKSMVELEINANKEYEF